MSRERQEVGNPGAGTLYVYGRLSSVTSGLDSSTSPGASYRALPETWKDVKDRTEEVVVTSSPDWLLESGIGEYTFVPSSSGGILGKGKFSTVYKVSSSNGQYYALKHTPLHPHHPLIAARLLREPTLLGQLPPHPCLIGVESWIRTPTHFYLVEEFPVGYIALNEHPSPLKPSRVAYILDQMVSVVRDCLHEKGRICHRDLKGENVLVNPSNGDIVILDLGLATHFTKNEPKLTTCCGSPAFHSPEIVNALNHPPGVVTYFGPEIDIWCIGLTILSSLLQTRFPIGTSHKSLSVMNHRIKDRLRELDQIYPPSSPWQVLPPHVITSLSNTQQEFEISEWRRVRCALEEFLSIDSTLRMKAFERYDVGYIIRDKVRDFELKKKDGIFKEISFLPSSPKYSLSLPLISSTTSLKDLKEEPVKEKVHHFHWGWHHSPDDTERDGKDEKEGKEDMSKEEPLILVNEENHSEKRILGYIKYLFRSSGILYHTLPTSSLSNPILQLVLPLPKTPLPSLPSPSPNLPSTDSRGPNWISSLSHLWSNNHSRRAISVPPKSTRLSQPLPNQYSNSKARYQTKEEDLSSLINVPNRNDVLSKNMGIRSVSKERWLKCWLRFDFLNFQSISKRRTQSRPRISRLSTIQTFTSIDETTEGQLPSTSTSSSNTSRASSTSRVESGTKSRVILTLSDPRGYKTLRSVVNVTPVSSGRKKDGVGLLELGREGRPLMRSTKSERYMSPLRVTESRRSEASLTPLLVSASMEKNMSTLKVSSPPAMNVERGRPRSRRNGEEAKGEKRISGIGEGHIVSGTSGPAVETQGGGIRGHVITEEQRRVREKDVSPNTRGRGGLFDSLFWSRAGRSVSVPPIPSPN
ncbi:CAMK/CAMKL protein kinase [Tremella mesenterica]|uniref:CAMK/CAMKL protein kinase n=1 Tax=Tremella mesenterica TaxID=5217 RepID=A0A4Q1BU66_TREME|nr:CAMK/CAMKL protein kinase [Tremella mesenterica]